MNVQPSPAKPSAKRTRKALGPRARILLVDDDERNLLALTEVLDPIAEVVTATSGREALRHLLKGDFAVILLDVFMPGMDGYETASLVREREQTSRIPIIFLSAVNKETEHLMRGYAMGAVDYVFKPVDPLILKSKVGVFVDLYEVRRQVEEKAASEQKLLDEMLTAHKAKLEAEKALRAAEETHSLMIGSLPIILFARDCAGELTPPRIIGGDLERVTGYSEPPSLEAWQERVHPDDWDRLVGEYRKLPEAGALAIEYRWRRADGAYRHFLEQTMVYVDRTTGRPEIVGTILDVTSQKSLEAQLVQAGKMDAIGQLTGGVAHDFNNLLSAVLGGLHVLERRLSLEDRDQLIIDQMRHAAEQGAELVRRMMAFARKQDLRPASVDPAMLCTTVAGLVEHTLGGTVEVDWVCSKTSGNLYVDKSQLELALVNLIINARDSMPKGGRVEVRIDDADPLGAPADLGLDERRYIRVRVQDDGEGIPSEIVHRITEPFFTTKAAGKGTGLGLSMVMGFIQQSEGKMRIDSAPGQGTTIDLYLPSTPQPTPEEVVKIDQPVSISTSRAVLLVDDDDAVRTVLGEQLREMGFRVDSVADGSSAIERLQGSTAYDVLLTDFAMPGINGLDTIRSAMIERPDMRFLLMTGYADEDAVAAVRETVSVIRKPINMDELMRRIG